MTDNQNLLTESDKRDLRSRLTPYEKFQPIESEVREFVNSGGPNIRASLTRVLFEISEGQADYYRKNSFETNPVRTRDSWEIVLEKIRALMKAEVDDARKYNQEWAKSDPEDFRRNSDCNADENGNLTSHPWGERRGERAEKFLVSVTPYQVWRCVHEAQEAAFEEIRCSLFDYIDIMASGRWNHSSAEEAASKAFKIECEKLAKNLD